MSHTLILVPMRITSTGSLVAQANTFGQPAQWVQISLVQLRCLGVHVSETFADSGYDNLGQFAMDKGIELSNVSLAPVKTADGKTKPVIRKEGAKEIPVTDSTGKPKHWNTLVPA